MIAELVSRINERPIVKFFMMDADLTSPDAKFITLDYQTATIPDADKKLLAYLKKFTLHV